MSKFVIRLLRVFSAYMRAFVLADYLGDFFAMIIGASEILEGKCK